MARKLQVVVVGDTRDLERALGRAGKSAHTFGQRVQRGARIAGLALAGGLAVAAKIGWDEMSEGLRVGAQTEAVLKSTGGQAHVTAQQVDELAVALMRKSGIDDEAIKSGENLLLTFRDIRNEAGKGNDIFDQATKATLDLSVAMKKDLASSSILVGKALNDPVRGLTALRRVGVQFTRAQERQIKALVETGDVMGAQKIILAELNKEFGGSAEAAGKTLPGKLNIAKESFRNMTGELMTALIPAITTVAEKLSDLAGFLSDHPKVAKAATFAIIALAGALFLASASAVLLNLALLANPIGLIVLGVAAAVVAFVILYKRFDKFRAVVDATVEFVKKHWQLLFIFLTGGMGVVVITIAKHWRDIRDKAVAAIGWIKDRWNALTETLKSAARSAGDTVRAVWGAIRDAFQAAIGPVRTLIAWVETLIGALERVVGLLEKLPGLRSGGTPSAPGPPGGNTGPNGPSDLSVGGGVRSIDGAPVSVTFTSVVPTTEDQARRAAEVFVRGIRSQGSRQAFRLSPGV